MKNIVLLAALTSLSYFATAQDKPTFGLKGGLNLATVGGKDISGTSALIGFHAGVQGSLSIRDAFSLHSELFYSAEGAKVKVETSGPGDEIIEATAKTHLNYLRLPVMLQYRHASGFYVASGPQVGYLLSAKLKGAGETADVKDEFKKIDLSWVLGVGYLIPNTKLGVDIRYNLGVTKLNKSTDGEDAGKAYGRAFQAGVFYNL